MKKIVKLTESDLKRIVKRVINEQEETIDGDLPKCNTLMQNENDMVGSSLRLNGPFDMVKANFTIGPKYQGYTLYKNGKKFCFIPK